jgi:hypothetical protein
MRVVSKSPADVANALRNPLTSDDQAGPNGLHNAIVFQ